MAKNFTSQTAMVFSYLQLRRTIGILGFLLPIVLASGSYFLFHMRIQSAISSYYHTPMRDVFVGTLCVIGFFLYSYRGYTWKDNIAGNVGCVFAVGLALFRTSPDPLHVDMIGHIHEVFAVLFFLTLIYFSLFLFTKTDPNTRPSRKKIQRNIVYKWCGSIMAFCLVLILVHYFLPVNLKSFIEPFRPAFWLESISIFAFSISWLVKGGTLLQDES